MSRLPAVVFAVLAVATGGAFFVVQHLKVTTPLVQNPSAPNPGAINPISGQVCGGVDHRRTTVTFYLLHRSDDVDVYVVDDEGNIVATLASGRHMRQRVRRPDGVFTWDGRLDDGRFAPDGLYRVQVDLIHQGRSVLLTPNGSTSPYTIKVESQAPHPLITSVTPQLVPQHGALGVRIRYRGNEGHVATMRIYRTDVPGRPQQVASFLTSGGGETTWNGETANRPAPAGIYLVGMDVTDAACNTGRFPASLPPAPGSTPRAGVTIRYLAAQPLLTPVPAGSRALVYVDSRQQPYHWALRTAGQAKILEHGHSNGAYTLEVRLPHGSAGLYTLSLRSGSHATTVPLIASAPRRAPVLVVLPALTWQGLNPVDDSGDGLASTLSDGDPVRLGRPLVRGLPAGFTDETRLVTYLRASHRSFDLTTDVALLQGAGPALSGHHGVILAGQERWIPRSLARALRTYVSAGGHVLSVAPDSLRAYVTVEGEGINQVARSPTGLLAADVFGVRHGAGVRHDSGLVTTITDGLGLFAATSGVFPGYTAYEPITGVSAPGQIASSAGTSTSAVSVVGVRLGTGAVVEVGLAGFIPALSTSLDTRELFDGIWSLLSR